MARTTPASSDIETVVSTESTTATKPVEGSGSKITIYPLRSYLDGKEIRRAGGKSYPSPKHDAVLLIAARLATDKDPKA